jgi:hypothetical protein
VLRAPVPGYLFDQCFRDRSITVIVAPAHRGKSMLMMDMAICLDLELPLFDKFTPVPGRKVFFLGCDAPEWDYRLQAQKLLIGHGIEPRKRELMDVNGVWRRGLNITDPNFIEWLKTWRRSTETDVLFIDSYRATNNADENSSGETKRVMDIICEMRDSGWAIVIAHHMGKFKEGVVQEDIHAGRGSTVISDSADFIFELSKRKMLDTRVQVSWSKGRGGAEDTSPFTFFDITRQEPSLELVNGKALRGIKLICSNEDPLSIIQQCLSQPTTREDIARCLRVACPVTCRDMNDEALYKFIDNRLTALKREGKARIVARGVWGR